MDLIDLTVNQLKRATAIKERIEELNNDLRNILGVSAGSGAAPKKKRTMSASGNRGTATKPAAKAQKKVFSAATRAKLSAKLKAYWAAKRAGKK